MSYSPTAELFTKYPLLRWNTKADAVMLCLQSRDETLIIRRAEVGSAYVRQAPPSSTWETRIDGTHMVNENPPCWDLFIQNGLENSYSLQKLTYDSKQDAEFALQILFTFLNTQ